MSGSEPPPIELRFVPPVGHRILRTFVDAATGYGVVEHVGDGQGAQVHVTLVDRSTGEVVPIERRAAEIPSAETVRVDEAHGLRLATRRTIDLRTGHEALHEVLTDAATGAVLWRAAEVDAFHLAAGGDLIARYLAWQAERARQEAWWRDEYPRWSFEKRAEYWYERIWRQVRWQEEEGLDPYFMFTPERYAEWRVREPEIGRILDAVIDRLGSGRAEIERRLERGQRRGPK